MIFAVQRLGESKRASLLAHFLALPLRDRSLRFGTSLAPRVIAAYVDAIDLERDAVLGVELSAPDDDHRTLIGAAHLAFEDNVAELALSVLPAHRERGIATALFQRSLGYARSRPIIKLVMSCLATNTAIMRIAQNFGMRIVAAGRDADAHLDLQPAAVSKHSAPSAERAASWLTRDSAAGAR